MARDWLAWHDAYDDPDSSLGQRLAHVRSLVGEALDALGPDAPGIVALCAGDGRDVLPVVAERGTTGPVLLVELDERLAGAAADRAAAAGLADVVVAVADAGETAVFADALPAGLLMLCGIFGNVGAADIHTTVSAARRMVRPGGFVIWTRGDLEPERRPQIRDWFVEAGFEVVAFVGPPSPYGVGMARLPLDADTPPGPLPERLFTFVR